MRFVIDLDSLELIESATDRRRVVQVEGKRGDDSPFEVSFVRSGVAEELAGSSVLTFGAKESGKYDAAAVVLNSDFALSGSGVTAKYLASPSFNTAELNALFLIDADDSNDVPFVDLMAEFTWHAGGAPSSSKTFTFRVHNDVIRDSEIVPTPGVPAWAPPLVRSFSPTDEFLGFTGTHSPGLPDMPIPGEQNDRPMWSVDSAPDIGQCAWEIDAGGVDVGGWVIHFSPNSGADNYQWTSLEDVASPDLVTEWTPTGGSETGSPVAERNGTLADALGQLCMVNGADVYTAARRIPTVWIQLN